MKNILDEIVADKKRAIGLSKKKLPFGELIKKIDVQKSAKSFIRAVTIPNQLSIIAEMKQSSPSAGLLIENYQPARIAKLYEKCGARALSILTEEHAFNGSLYHIEEVQRVSSLPILRKDFIIDLYQVYESKLAGASAILLIVKILKPSQYLELMKESRSLKLDVLVEIHSEKDLEIALKGNPQIIGINNRNLTNGSIEIKTTFDLIEKVPCGIPVVSESGIKSSQSIAALKSAGVKAALIGESILKSSEKSKLLKSFVKEGVR